MNIEHGGQFCDNETLTHCEIGRRLGYQPRWVIENMLRCGLQSKKVGRYYVTTGYFIRLWIEQSATAWGDGDA